MAAKVYYFNKIEIMEDLSLFAREICNDFKNELSYSDFPYDEDQFFLYADEQISWAGLTGWKKEYVTKRLEAYCGRN